MDSTHSRSNEPVADLHLHSTASDGSDPPAVLVRRAKEAGLTAIALADHDTMDGVPEALREAERIGIECIPAVEYSCIDGNREVHMLGYGLDPADERLRAELTRLRVGRFDRAKRMVERLNELGYAIEWARVQEIAGDENVGRPHVASALLEAGYIASISEAFTVAFIGNGGRAYVERVKITPEEAIRQIREAGGVAVLAHPGRFRSDDDQIDDLTIERYIASGLQGIEVFYSKHTPEMVERYLAMTERHGLIATGGSDDHGRYKDEALLGQVRLPYRYVEALKKAIEAQRRANAGHGTDGGEAGPARA